MTIHKAKDNSFKTIFDDHQLFAEFLRDYVPIDMLKDVQSDDIEDVNERFLPLFQENRDADTVKRVKLRGKPPLFIITILEHESKVNFRTPFKLLLYISLVLDKYEKEVQKEYTDIIFTKGFRYPLVLPIVFYDGEEPWTAARNLAARTEMGDLFHKYIPTFEYILVSLKDHSIEDVQRFADVLGVFMLMDKASDTNAEEILRALNIYIEKTGLKIPENQHKLITDNVQVMLNRLSIPQEEIEAITSHFGNKEYQGMIEAMLERVGRFEETAIKRGVEKGRQQATLENARGLKERGVPDTVIAEALKLPPDVVARL
jgi:hypothetical protein